ncbi:putative secreted protein [Corynebacterium halotolerans YIM 70093 = DSM 44683]|uniref:Putative secreted protein n=1 Tax=Corynebacterium halotolerans YIM 70093 = DSM 44683 TaxID=1121362 RepID=M1NQ42_9CORY|nr:putative secreted protein [Corynebacterium halotolerans YIM 70093 = DSM 44683]
MNQDNQTSGLPLRGLAMVLIAVALLLGLWGLYALTQDDDSDPSTAADSNGTATAPAERGTEDAGSADTPDGDREPAADAPTGTAETPADGDTDAEAGAGDGAAADPGRGTADADAPAPAGEGTGGKAPAPERLNVLNNSTVPNLAAEVSETLSEEGHRLGEVGNLADEIMPENTVFFQPGNAAAEERARKLADRVGGVAREYIDTLPDETEGANDITLVLVGQVAL